LIEKAYSQKQRGVIFCDSPEHLKELDSTLWTFGRLAFIPHGSSQDGIDSLKQPFWLTCTAENPNNAQVGFMTSGELVEKDLKLIKICDIFDGNDDTLRLNAEKRIKHYQEQGYKTAWWVQGMDGKWTNKTDSLSMVSRSAA
jgi:DNA polymerase-3 subunit chi